LPIPPDVRPDLAERYRQLRTFDRAETSLVRGLVKRPDRIARTHEIVLRQSLNLARCWVINGGGAECVVGPQLGNFRDRIRPLAEAMEKQADLDPRDFANDADQIASLFKEEKESLLNAHLGRLTKADLDRELSEKALVVAVGGGGGCGYVHLGAFSVLEQLRLRPRLLVGSSIGSVLGLFRAREESFRDSTVRAVTHGLTFTKLFRVLDTDCRYAMPGTLRLYLRTSLSRFFMREDGEAMRIRDLAIPFIVVVTGVQRSLVPEVQDYEALFRQELRRGALGRLLHLKDLVTNMAVFMSRLIATAGALRPIPLGSDSQTSEFDVLDAVGFSASVPAVIQYDIHREDPRMHALVQQVLAKHGVDALCDGGISSNVPARFAWEHVQSGGIGSRNAFVLGLDCFAPQIGRNMLFLPLQRIAAENVSRDAPFAHLLFTYRRVLSPTSLVPRLRSLELAIKNGREEFLKEAPFLQKMLEPLPAL
jgi:predicted acylesterase/phospholipase RssA